MKKSLIILLLLFPFITECQTTTIYFFPGQGADRHLFDSLSLIGNYTKKVIEYGTPKKNTTIQAFAMEILPQIDTTEAFILVGVSLGGMICVELDELVHSKKTIIISSAKNVNELPFRYRFQQKIPVYKLVPGKLMLGFAKVLQPIVEPDSKKCKKTFQNMLSKKTGPYMKNTVSMIINWDRTTNSNEIVHIHGTKDHTIPIRNIAEPFIQVENGSHMMTLTNGHVISNLLTSELQKIN
ncbi:MAG: hypothetical protein RLZZ493_703 [Bacteroidota bacterium]